MQRDLSVTQLATYHLFLNYSCNARCSFCFNPAAPSLEEKSGPGFAAIARELYRGRQQGFQAVNFLGGEVTIRPDFIRIVAMARKIGYGSISMDTNGLRLADPEFCRLLAGAGMRAVRFSVHGHTPELHDGQVRVPGAFHKVLDAVNNLKSLGVSIGLNFVINQENYNTLEKYVSFFVDEVRIRDFSFSYLRYIGHMELPPNRLKMMVSMSEAAPYVRRAFEVLSARGVVESVSLNDFVPCVLPGHEKYMRDWSTEPNLDGVLNPDGTTQDSVSVCHSGKVKIDACGRCAYNDRCLGVEGAYLGVFGAGEFKPL